jgi:hypothetical protein
MEDLISIGTIGKDKNVEILNKVFKKQLANRGVAFLLRFL